MVGVWFTSPPWTRRWSTPFVRSSALVCAGHCLMCPFSSSLSRVGPLTVTSRNICLRHLRSYDTSAPSTSPTSTTISHYTLSIIKVSLYSLVFFVFLCILKNNISYDTSAMTTICTNTLCYVPTQLSTIASATD